MNPLSFVTIFTFGELGTTLVLAVIFLSGAGNLLASLDKARPMLFWLFLGGFCCVLGDLFQQYAAKYIGIGRGIPLSNTNQLWGLAWGAFVFGELAGRSFATQPIIIAGSLIMVAGAAAISFSDAGASEKVSWNNAVERECERYGLERVRVSAILQGDDPLSREGPRRRWWEFLFVAAALGIFLWLAFHAGRQPITINVPWMIVLSTATLVFLLACGRLLWKRTGFS